MKIGSELEKAAEIILRGGLVIYPTETFYALGANALNKEAVEKVFKVKKRSLYKPISVIIADRSWLKELVVEIPEVAIALIENFWPGALTIIFKANPKWPSKLTAGTGKVGIRLSSHPIAQKLVSWVNVPITATSANISGQPPPSDVKSISLNRINFIISGGSTPGDIPSTIIDVTSIPPLILREGAIKLRSPDLS